MASRGEEHFVPFMFVHPFLDSPRYLEGNSPDFTGFKLYPRAQGMEYNYEDLALLRNTDFLLSTQKTLIFHTGFRPGTRIKNLLWLRERAKGNVVLVHTGDLIEEDLERVKDIPNMYIDMSPLMTMICRNFFVASPQRPKSLERVSVGNILDYLREMFVPEKILWGSDSPWCDNLTKEGYSGEIDVLNEMEKRGFPNELPLERIK